MKKLFPILALLLANLFWVHTVVAQQPQGQARELLNTAREQMAAEDFQAANQSFRKMLNLKTVLPTEMCYYFAATLFALEQYENSLRFTEKYLQLAGAGGEFFRESKELQSLLKEKMSTIRNCSSCDSQGYVLEACPNCEATGQLTKTCSRCYGRKQLTCLPCEGEGVVIEKNHFNQHTYLTCQRCQGKGTEQCPTCEGEGKTVQNCGYCKGSGLLPTARLCTHPGHSLEQP